MTQELSQKSEEIRKYHVEQAVVFSRIRELVGHPGEVINKAHLYDQIMESADPSSARQTLPILVKYSQMMNDMLKEIQKVVPLSGTPRRVLYPGPPESPTGTLYRESEKWSSYLLLRQGLGPTRRAEPPNIQIPEGFRIERGTVLRKGLALPRFAGRALGRSDPKEASPLL